MKVLFVYPVPLAKFQMLRFQQGIASISAVLKKAGHETKLITVSGLETERLDSILGEFRPQLVALSLTSGFFDLSASISRWVSAKWKLPVLLGGVHPTLCPEESLAAEGVFAICRGEGEYPMLELCEALEKGKDPSRIQNLWIKLDGREYRNEIRPLIADLDSLPYPDRELFNFGDMMNEFAEAEFMGSRGCPYKCAYCVNHALQDLFKDKGPYVRFRSINNLMGEISEVTKRYPKVGLLGFHDDTFTLKRAWLQEFAEKYPKNSKLPFWCNATANSITEETAMLLKQAGCFEVRIGVESGNDRIRDQILDKHVSREEIVGAFRCLREAGITTYAFNMIGLPYETVETVYDTIRLNREIRPSQMFCSVFYPFPGTKARKVCEENGWLTGKAISSYFENDYAVNQPSITRQEVLFYHDIFRELVSFPKLEWLIKAMARIPVTRNKSLWNVWRRIRVKCKEYSSYFRMKMGLKATGPEIWRGWKK